MTKRRRTKGTGSIYTRKDGRVVGEYEVNGKLKDETIWKPSTTIW
jgi:hypothetical protein